jgi:hypothetical protein
MADDNWLLQRGAERLGQINAARSQAVADLERAKSEYDDSAAMDAIQQIADLDQAAASLNALYSRYTASQTPPPQPSQEERKARTWDRMDWQDIVDMTRQSKYAKNIRPDDPNMIAGYQEAMRRRGRGE